MISVLATDRISKRGLLALSEDERFAVRRVHESGSDEFRDELGKADALIVRSATKVDGEMIGRAPHLRAIGRAGVGVDNIDVMAATARGIPVFNAPGGNTVAAAELTMALMLSLVRRVTQADRSIREGRWDRADFQGVELRGRTLGLVGAGRVGGEVARRCQAFGMSVIAYDPYLTPQRAEELGIEMVDLKTVVGRGDVISLHVPLSDETRGLIGPKALSRMKKKAVLINASRGGVIDEQALAEALSAGKLAGAALDVYEQEPLPVESPLRRAPNLVLTPHLGASTKEAQISVAREVALALKDALTGGDLTGAVNAAELI